MFTDLQTEGSDQELSFGQIVEVSARVSISCETSNRSKSDYG